MSCAATRVGARREHRSEAARPAVSAEHLGLRSQRIAQPAQQRGTRPSSPDQRIRGRALEHLGQPLHASDRAGRRRRPATDVPRRWRRRRRRTRASSPRPGPRIALKRCAGGCLEVAPVRACAGVEQHADHGKVDQGAGTRRSRPLRRAAHPARPCGPRRRPRNGASGCDTGCAGRDSGARVTSTTSAAAAGSAVVVQAEPERVACTRAVRQILRTLADGGRGAQRSCRACGPAGVVVGTDAYEAHPSNPRPFGFLNSSASGTAPGVK